MNEYFGVNEICLKPTPVTTVTKIWKFEYKLIIISQLACDAVPYTHDRKTANINVKTYQFKTRCKDDMVNSVN